MRAALRGNELIELWGTTDAEQIGLPHLVVLLRLAGIEALLMRVELARPGMQFLSPPKNDRG
ncbi:hypothetical protein [Micromonospora chersina]|uniref:hypothetical protein n=1 Tax=Micromonospora chersina TaxID=47854 RepID=UPI00371956D3